MKRWPIILTVVLLGIVVWLYFGISRVVQAEKDVIARFDDLVRYYTEMNTQYIVPVMTNPELGEGDRQALSELKTSLDKLQAMQNRDDQYEALRALQKKMLGFFATTIVPESVSVDSRYQQWNKNVTNFGGASSVLKAYNDALGLYNALTKSSAEKIVTYWRSWEHRQYLAINGDLEDTPQVSF